MTKTTQYKNTPIGPIPTDWEVKKLNEVTDYVDYRGKTPQKTENGILLITAKNIKEGFIDYEVSKEYVAFESYNQTMSRGLPKTGDILFTTEAPLGNVAQVDNPNIALAQRVIKFSGKSSLDNTYLKYHFLSDNFQKTIDIKSTGGTVKGIKGSVLHRLQIPLPPLEEQQKIAEVLSTWDKAIQETDAIIKKLEDRNKALAFSLLTGKKRVNGFEDKEFIKSLANEVFKSVSIKNNPEDSVLLSATQEFGMIPRDMIETRVTMPSGSLKTYKLVEKGDFVISLRSFQGGIEYSEYTGLVSPAYTVLKSINPINDDFYKYYFKSEDLIGRLSVAVIGIRDGKNISYDDFSTIVLPNPSLEEQNAIAEILNTANQEVKQYQQKLEALKLQKKGLMQQLLTGKVRTV